MPISCFLRFQDPLEVFSTDPADIGGGRFDIFLACQDHVAYGVHHQSDMLVF